MHRGVVQDVYRREAKRISTIALVWSSLARVPGDAPYPHFTKGGAALLRGMMGFAPEGADEQIIEAGDRSIRCDTVELLESARSAYRGRISGDGVPTPRRRAQHLSGVWSRPVV